MTPATASEIHLSRISTLLVLAGCNTGAPADSWVRTDSAGVEIIHHYDIGNEAPDRWTLGAEPLLSIGSADGDDALYRVTAAALLSDGSVVILNSGTTEVRRYDRQGVRQSTFGHSGSGPGEFRAMGRRITILPADSIVVFDPRLRRATTIARSGRPATTTFSIPPGAIATEYIGRLPGGFHLLAHTAARGATDVGTVFQDSVRLVRHRPEGTVAGEFARLVAGEMTSISRGGGMVQVMAVPFAGRSHIEPASFGIVVADARVNEVRVYSYTGALERIIRRDDPLAPLPQEHRDAYAAADFPGMTLPHTLPPFDRVVAGSDNLVWLGRGPVTAAEAMMTWDALDATGTIVKRLSIPKELTVHQITDSEVVASERDAMGVEYVRVHALERS